MPPLFPLSLALYAAACTLYFIAVAQPQLSWPSRLASPLVTLGVIGQALDIAWLCIHGQHPGSSAREALFFVSWLMLLVLPLRTYRQPIPLLGALLLPTGMVMDVLVRVVPVNHAAPALSAAATSAVSARLVSLHIFSATLGIALFGVSAAASIVYLLSERRLKRRQPMAANSTGGRGPSLETLDRWNQQGIVFGLFAFTVALISGTFWLLQIPVPFLAGVELGILQQARHLLSEPRYSLAVVTWLLYAGLLICRAVFGMRGRRAAQVTLIGFITALTVLLVYVARDVRGPHL